MCGIVSYIGYKPASEVLFQGLRSLEYRGYDSAGIAVLSKTGEISVAKSTGKISELESLIKSGSLVTATKTNDSSKQSFSTGDAQELENSSCGIGHTRWATHGQATVRNAHPHSSKGVTLVHNGIIKNYLELKRELEASGVSFSSDTDSEVVAHLFARYRSESSSDMQALAKTTQRLEGSYALAVLSEGLPRKILAAKNESPLVIGIGDKENYIASDSSTVLQFTDRILKLKDKQIAEVTEASVNVTDLNGNSVKTEIQQLSQTSSILDKGAYKHYLLKEIHEQPAVIGRMLADYEHDERLGIQKLVSGLDVKKLGRIVLVACGSAFHAALAGKYLIELWAQIPVEVALASEYASSPALLGARDLVIGISQSGETADTLAAVRNAVSGGAQIAAITNKADSALFELAKPNTYVTPAGIEVSVASTKAYTSQLMSLYLLALSLAEARSALDAGAIAKIKSELHKLPQLIDQCIERSEGYHNRFIRYSIYRDFLFLSRGLNYPTALEGALKLKELSYIHATGYAAGEMKHGPIAILDQNVPVLSIAISGDTEYEQNIYLKTLHNAEEARARKSPSLVVACDDNADVDEIFDEVLRIPNVSQIYSPLVAIIPLQFLAYAIAEDLGKDVDQPRNLAKSVTVE